ncbi:cerebellar degeneration-related protein 2-like [Gigantopelta aegis]|uniref:cerebellar degeneration-related protein 2-like n=1 Tax=Gigantopelta aegis TaxID=1735272 RepID=UPI001B88B1DC|nr:cerebellar degeneration-related protein 2-like [Gigantopelta aegis]
MDEMDSCETYESENYEADWYENDLQLAAELGKALLERNRELEAEVSQLQQTNSEQSQEIQYLNRQLETIRTMDESRMRIYEELERNSLEIERTNQKLQEESKSDKQKINRLVSTVDHLESKVEDLQKKIDDLKTAAVARKQERRRAVSLASLLDHEAKTQLYQDDLTWSYTEQFKNLPLNPYELEIQKLQDKVHHLKSLQSIEKNKREKLELENMILIQENEILENRVSTLELNVMDLQRKEKLELPSPVAKSPSDSASKSKVEVFCSRCETVIADDECQTLILKEVEHDDPTLSGEGKAVKLGGGGSLYGSTESINKVATDAQEISDKGGMNGNRSILDELEAQYKTLFTKYEAVIQGRFKRISGDLDDTVEERMRKRLANKGVQTLLNLTKHNEYAQEGTQLAPYKILFKELFATLRQTRIEEGAEKSPSPSSTPITSESKAVDDYEN